MLRMRNVYCMHAICMQFKLRDHLLIRFLAAIFFYKYIYNTTGIHAHLNRVFLIFIYVVCSNFHREDYPRMNYIKLWNVQMCCMQESFQSLLTHSPK